MSLAPTKQLPGRSLAFPPRALAKSGERLRAPAQREFAPTRWRWYNSVVSVLAYLVPAALALGLWYLVIVKRYKNDLWL